MPLRGELWWADLDLETLIVVVGRITMSERKLARIQEKGQVTLPAESRHRRGVKKGDLVEITETEEGWLITPSEVMAAASHSGRALSEKEVQQGLAGLDRANHSQQELLDRQGGMPSSSSVEIIDEVRQEMTGRHGFSLDALVAPGKAELDRLLAERYPDVASLQGAAGTLPRPMSWKEVREIAREDALGSVASGHNG